MDDSFDLALWLPQPVAARLVDMAADRDLSVEALARRLIAAAVFDGADTPAGLDGDAAPRAALANALSRAVDWDDAQERLRSIGATLKERGAGLVLVHLSDGQPICRASELGASYGTLLRRFAAPFPGHAHRAMARRMLATRSARVADLDWDDPDFQLVEMP